MANEGVVGAIKDVVEPKESGVFERFLPYVTLIIASGALVLALLVVLDVLGPAKAIGDRVTLLEDTGDNNDLGTKVNNLETKVNNLGTKVTDLEKKVDDPEASTESNAFYLGLDYPVAIRTLRVKTDASGVELDNTSQEFVKELNGGAYMRTNDWIQYFKAYGPPNNYYVMLVRRDDDPFDPKKFFKAYRAGTVQYEENIVLPALVSNTYGWLTFSEQQEEKEESFNERLDPADYTVSATVSEQMKTGSTTEEVQYYYRSQEFIAFSFLSSKPATAG